MKYHSISVDQYIYSNSFVDKYMYTDTVNKSTNFYNINLPFDMIFTMVDAFTNDDQVEKFTREFNIRLRPPQDVPFFYTPSHSS